MHEALDNLVLTPTISKISNLSCKETNEKWIKRSDLELSVLRKARNLINDERKLFETLIKKDKKFLD